MRSNEDLVELMLMVATGNKLPQRLIDQPFIQHNGWSIESRVYAEDPLRSFLPSIGPLLTYKEPLETRTNEEVILIYNKHVHIHMHTNTYACTYICMHIHMHTHTYAYTYICIYIHVLIETCVYTYTYWNLYI